MTNDNHLFKSQSGAGRLPLYEGKMIHQFVHTFSKARYWVNEKEGRKHLLGRTESDPSRKLDYQSHRFGFRDVARNTDMRTMIAAYVPSGVFAGNTLIVGQPFDKENEGIFVCSALNSFVFDFMIRQKVSAHCNMFYVYQVPVPRLTCKDAAFAPIVNRTPDFDDLAQNVGSGSHKNGSTDPTERAKLRAELDGMIAHLYGVTEEEFRHILSTFPLVDQKEKDAALEVYKALSPKPGDQEVAALITKGESAEIEFKSSARWDMRQNKLNKEMEQIVVKTVAGFMNSETGGMLLIGVEDGGIF